MKFISARQLVVVIFETLFCIAGSSAMLVAQCRSVAGGTWIEPGGFSGDRKFTLSQNVETGAIGGTSFRSICQTQNWPVTGQFLGNGEFTLTITNPSPSDPTCTADWVTYEFNPAPDNGVKLPGCQNASATWSNSNGQSGFLSWSKPCDLPTGETVIKNGWNTDPTPPGFRTVHRWGQILTATNTEINFGGREVSENFPQNGTDGCYFQGSTFPEQFKPTAFSWIVGQLDGVENGTFNIWGNDHIGWTENFVNYYQFERINRALDMPCEFVISQEVRIRCTSGTVVYSTAPIRMGIGETDVTSTHRTGGTEWRPWMP